MAKKETTPTGSAPQQGSTLVGLSDRADRVQMRFLAREIRLRNGKYAAIKSGVARLQLRESRKEIAVWKTGNERTAMITAEGYRACNSIAQITVLTPPSLEVPGVGRVANPHVNLYEETGAFKSGWIRKIAVAPGPLGNLVLCDRTTYLSLVEYLMEDLIGVAKRNPTAVCWGIKGQSPAETLIGYVEEHNRDLEERAKKEDKQWLLRYRVDKAEAERAVARIRRNLWGFYPVEPITGQGLWFDRTAESVAGVFRSYAQTGKFGIRKLEAIAYRNVLRDHPLMPGMSLGQDNLLPQWGDSDPKHELDPIEIFAEVSVYFHEQVQDEDDVKQILRDFEAGLRTAAFAEVGGDKAPQRASVNDADADAGDEDAKPKPETTEELGKEDGAADPRRQPVAPPKPAPVPTDPNAALIAEIATAEEILGAEAAGAILDQHATVKRARRKASTKDLRAYLTALSNAINQKNAE